MHLETPVFGQQKTPIKSGFLRNISFLCSFYGGEGEIRTLEPCYGLRDFQSRALDQLGDFSKLFAFGTYIHCFHKQPLYNSMSGGKNQDIFQKKMNFFVSPRKAAKRAGFPPFSYAAMLNLPSHTRRHASPVHLPAVALFLVLGKRLDFTAEGRMRNFFRKQFVV